MPERPQYISQEQIATPGFGRALPMPLPDKSGEILGLGVESAAKQIDDAGRVLADVQNRKRAITATADADLMFVKQAQQAEVLVQGLKNGATYDGYAPSVLKALDALGNEGLKNLKDPLAQAEFKKRFDTFHLTRYNEALKFGNQLYHQYLEGTLATRLNWSMHEAAKLGANGGYEIVGQAVQDAYNRAVDVPEMAGTILKATDKFVKDAVGRMMRQDWEANPQQFSETGAAKWKDRTLGFDDKAGVHHEVVIGADPNLVAQLTSSATRRAEAMANKRNALRTAMEKEMTDFVRKQGETDVSERYDMLLAHPELGWTREDEAKFAKYAHQDSVGREAIEKLKNDVIRGAIAGVSVPGSFQDTMYRVTTGEWGLEEIVKSDLSSGDKVKAIAEWRRMLKEDDLVHIPAYQEYEKLVRAAVGAKFPLPGFSIDPHPKAQAAVIEFRRRMRQPGTMLDQAGKIADEVIQLYAPGTNYGPAKPKRGEPKPDEKKGKTNVEPESFGSMGSK